MGYLVNLEQLNVQLVEFISAMDGSPAIGDTGALAFRRQSRRDYVYYTFGPQAVKWALFFGADLAIDGVVKWEIRVSVSNTWTPIVFDPGLAALPQRKRRTKGRFVSGAFSIPRRCRLG